MFTCFAYSSSGTFNLLAIATCEDVSFTVLRPSLYPDRVAEATVCTGVRTGLDDCSVLLPNL